MIKIKNIAFVLLLFICAYKPFHAQAQSCAIVPATITTMNEPEIGAYNLWDHVAGAYPDDETFIGAFKDDHNLITASLGIDKTPDQKHFIVVSLLDKRGRQQWHKKHVIDHLSDVHAIVPHPKGLAILASLSQQDKEGAYTAASVWFGVFDKANGTLLENHNLSADKKALAVGMIAEPTQKGYIITAKNIDTAHDKYSVLYHVDLNGKVQKRRAFRNGTNNQAHTIIAGDDYRIFVAGEALAEDKRSIGWAMGLDYNLNLLWETTFPRGEDAAFTRGVSAINDYVVFGGRADPFQQPHRAAWVMMLEAAGGQPVWERFYGGERPYEMGAMLNNKTGTLSLLINGAMHPDEENTDKDDPIYFTYKPYVRLLTLDARGSVVFAEDYTNAQGANATAMILGDNKQRIIMGATQSPDLLLTEKKKIPGAISHRFVSQNSWAFAIPAPSVYDDPCK